MVLLEGSSIFLSFSWLLRNVCSFRDSIIVKLLEFCFALSFFLLRIIHLTLTMWALKDILMSDYPALGLIMSPLLLMQYWWFYKIATYKKKKEVGKEE